MVKSYTYLGATLSSSTMGKTAAEAAIKKGKFALSSALQSLNRSRADSWDGMVKLFDGVVSSALLYSAEVWGLKYTEQLEIVQSTFFKKLLSLPQGTPNAHLGLELGLVKLSSRVFRRAWSLIIKILQLPDSRYSKICLLRLIHLHGENPAYCEYNWVSQFDKMLKCINMSHLWDCRSHTDWEHSRLIAFQRFDRYLKFSDVLYCADKSELMYCKILRSLHDKTAAYLQNRTYFYMSKIIAQLRLSSKHVVRFCMKGEIFNFNQNSSCKFCTQCVIETPMHFLFECPLYAPLRLKYLDQFVCLCDGNYQTIMNCLDFSILKPLYFYIVNALRLRSTVCTD